MVWCLGTFLKSLLVIGRAAFNNKISWSEEKEKNEPSVYSLPKLNQISLPVKRGDLFYFRLISILIRSENVKKCVLFK